MLRVRKRALFEVRRPRLRPRPLGVLAMAGLWVGCIDQSPPTDPIEPRWCSALCDLEQTCYSVPRCQGDCLERNEGYLERMNTAHLEREIACYGRTPACDVETALDNCFQDALAAAQPTDDSKRLCAAMARVFFECGWYASPGTCEVDFGAYSGAALERIAQACGDVECDTLATCVTDALGS